jgi:hypothetical protein
LRKDGWRPMTPRSTLTIALAAGGLAACLSAQPSPSPRCDAFASPSGKGNGSSPERASSVAAFWKRAAPGSALCLLDGRYTGPDAMITPPRGLAGRSGDPIVVQAWHDGKVLIDGENIRRPVVLNTNDWFVVEGINACCSSASVVEIAHASHDLIRRVAGWDAHDGNDKIFAVHDGEHNTLEDVAGWGTARKTFEFSFGGDFTTVRRAWGRWERSTVSGPKMVYSLAYNNYHALIENALGTWNGAAMPESYVVKTYDGRPYTGPGAGMRRGADVIEAYGAFSMDGIPEDRKADARLLGSLAYVQATDAFAPKRLIFVTKMDGVEIANTAAYFPPGRFLDKITFGLYALAHGQPAADSATNITGFGGAGPEIHPSWRTANSLHGASPAGAYRAGESLFHSVRGASLCSRYQDGTLTDQPLWPWPMNQRIIDAMIQSRREPVDITATVERLFGPIPAPCREATSPGEIRETTPPPAAPESGQPAHRPSGRSGRSVPLRRAPAAG